MNDYDQKAKSWLPGYSFEGIILRIYWREGGLPAVAEVKGMEIVASLKLI